MISLAFDFLLAISTVTIPSARHNVVFIHVRGRHEDKYSYPKLQADSLNSAESTEYTCLRIRRSSYQEQGHVRGAYLSSWRRVVWRV